MLPTPREESPATDLLERPDVSEVLDGIDDGVYALDRDWRVTYANQHAAANVGLDPDELIGRNLWEAFPSLLGTELETRFRAVMASRQPQTFEKPAVRDDRCYNLRVSPFRDGIVVVFTDITALKRIQFQEERLQSLMDHNPSLIFMKDEQGRYVYMNEAYRQAFVQTAEWAGKTDFDFWPAESATLFRANDAAVLAAGETQQFLEDAPDLAGERHCWLNYKFPFIDAQGRRYLGGIGIDVVDRVRAEEALRAQQEAYRLIVEHAPTGIYELDYTVPCFTRVNDAMCSILGYTRDELLALNPLALLDDESRVRFQARIRQVLAGECIDEDVSFRVLGRDGRVIDAELHVKLLDDEGAPARALVVAHDVTERNRAEAALRESEARFRSVLDSSLDAAYRRDLRVDAYDYMSPVIASLTGFTAEEFNRLSLDEVMARVHPEDRARVAAGLQAVLDAPDGNGTLDYRFRRRDGEYIWLADRLSIIRDADGRPIYLVGSVRDVSAQKAYEQALLEADRAKDEFLAVVSHELQTPLTSMLGWSSEALNAGTPEMLARAMPVVHRNALRQKALIDELLDTSRLIHHKLALDLAVVDLGEQAQQAVENCRQQACQREVELTLSLADSPLPVRGDARRLQQCLGNLLNNSLKFTPAGGSIRVHCRSEGESARVVIEDTGRGIAPEQLPLIFELFRQVDRNEQAGGLGLGLAITQRLVELHGGTLQAHSDGPNRGSRFTLTLPIDGTIEDNSPANPTLPSSS